jgi:tetratricopeptide (TPR) repeat protein
VRLHDITTLYIDFPKEEEAGNLVAYRECLRSAVALAHQIAVRWVLSKYGTKNRFLSIAIVAGDFANLDNHLLPLLNARLPGDPVIRLSDYARQCLLINDIRTILCPKPTETTLFNGESLPIWWITGLWTTLYFDFVSDLLEDDILQTGAQSVEKLDRFLWSPEEYRITGQEGGRDSAVATFFKFPHNSLLGVEIAKTLYYRRRFSEAAEILRIVLSINPTDLVARTLRMVLFRNMALDAPSHHAAAAIFRQAKQEADYIRENCDFQAEDFYCEYGAVYLAEAMSTVRYTRTSPEIAGDAARMEKLRAEVYSALDQAQYLFERGMSVSPSGIRASYLLNSAAVLKAILSSDEELFFNAEKPIAGEAGIGHEESTDVQWQIGYRRSDVSGRDLEFLAEKMMITKGAIHDSSISLHSYRPTTYFCNAVALWDFLPVRTVLTAKKVMERIRGAMEIARRAQKENVCIYSFTRTYGEMIPAEEYIQHMEKALKMIEEAGGGDLGGREDSEILPAPPGGRQPLLLTLNF